MEPLAKEIKGKLNLYTYEELEKKIILLSLYNLMSYPFIVDAIKKRKLIVCGLWHNIETGELEVYNDNIKKFQKV